MAKRVPKRLSSGKTRNIFMILSEHLLNYHHQIHLPGKSQTGVLSLKDERCAVDFLYHDYLQVRQKAHQSHFATLPQFPILPLSVTRYLFAPLLPIFQAGSDLFALLSDRRLHVR